MSNIHKIIIDKEDYCFIKNYKDNDKYRKSLNSLAMKIYGFDFEDWYQHGYWGDKYCPYSLIHKDEVVANVSLNPIDFMVKGERIHTMQIGTVMTDEAYRNKGLSKELMKLILNEYENDYDLIYLYANDTVLNFYPKFGFEIAQEYIYTTKADQIENKSLYRKLNIKDGEDQAIINRLVVKTKPVSKCQMIENQNLIFFYLTSFMSNSIYYFEELDLAVVVEEENCLKLLDVYSEKEFDLNHVIGSLVKKDGTEVVLGFTPLDTSPFHCEPLKEDGLTFFVKGEYPIDKGRFPALSHA